MVRKLGDSKLKMIWEKSVVVVFWNSAGRAEKTIKYLSV
jgi:hypothetical protein